MVEQPVSDGQRPVDAALGHLPRRLRPTVERMLGHWPGRMLLRTIAAFIRVELFDRSMAIAAQFFTSVFPTVIMLGALFGGRLVPSDPNELPPQTKMLLEDALSESSTAFGIAGTVIVLASATSLSRALGRAYASIWMLPRPRARLRSAWRWLAVVIVFPLFIMLVPVVKRYAGELPPATIWGTAAAALIDTALVVFVPWILLSGRVPPRQLVPSGLLFAGLMVFVRPASARWLPHALDVSAARYGTFGVAFTYLAWLYVISWCLLVASTVGQVVTTDPGRLGRWVRGERAAPTTDAPLDAAESPGTGEAASGGSAHAEADPSDHRPAEERAP